MIYFEIINHAGDGGIVEYLYGRGFSRDFYDIKFEDSSVGVGDLFFKIMGFEGAIVHNGFQSIFDQTVVPWELETHERFLEVIGATEFLEHFRKCRHLYFGDDPVPKNNDEWDRFRSIIWREPEGPVSLESDAVAEKAVNAYYWKIDPSEDYSDMHQKLGAYFREHLAELMAEDEFLT